MGKMPFLESFTTLLDKTQLPWFLNWESAPPYSPLDMPLDKISSYQIGYKKMNQRRISLPPYMVKCSMYFNAQLSVRKSN